jgi:cytochrome c biogenesis protein
MTFINQVWNFFASVKLAIVTLCALAVTSIIGTLIPQGESPAYYVDHYGPGLAQFFQILDIPEMYYSWWFLGLLGILSANLTICSIERLPTVWKIIQADNLNTSTNRLFKMQNNRFWPGVPETTAARLKQVLQIAGWKFKEKQDESNILLFGEKGKYSRLGVYIVHLSILVIFVGAIIGHFYGFKGSVMLPELRTTDRVFAFGDSKPLDLGFQVRCNLFEIEFYANGMPKEYTSSLTVLENGREILTKSIEVNDPLDYKGFTFYQSSYQGYQDFVIDIEDAGSGGRKHFTLPFQKQQAWREKNVQFGIINAEAIDQRVVRAKLWFKASDLPAFTGWVNDNESVSIPIGDKNFNVHVKQMYATGLQVAKDPGVWVVYIGCGLMLFGLYMAFFMSHQRLWMLLEKTGEKRLLLCGSTNKNKIAFRKNFEKLEKQLEEKIQ